MATFQEAVESLYDMTGAELRALAWEALLISDGPDAVHSPTEEGDSVRVEVVNVVMAMGLQEVGERRGFTLTGRDGWETAHNTMPDTPIK